MNIALSGLRSVLLGALGGLLAFALASWIGYVPAPAPTRAPHAAPMAHTIASRSSVALESAPSAHEAARRLIVEAARASLYDALAAHLVRERSADAAVQELAATLLHDHQTAWPALAALARDFGVALPQAPTAAQRDHLALLRDVASHTRELMFVRHVGVEAALAEIERLEAAREGLGARDAPLRGWIEQTLTALRERAALSQRLLPRVAEQRAMA